MFFQLFSEASIFILILLYSLLLCVPVDDFIVFSILVFLQFLFLSFFLTISLHTFCILSILVCIIHFSVH